MLHGTNIAGAAELPECCADHSLRVVGTPRPKRIRSVRVEISTDLLHGLRGRTFRIERVRVPSVEHANYAIEIDVVDVNAEAALRMLNRLNG